MVPMGEMALTVLGISSFDESVYIPLLRETELGVSGLCVVLGCDDEDIRASLRRLADRGMVRLASILREGPSTASAGLFAFRDGW
ncbi:helix-turn-helix domain-containing protein [Streptomyces sp. CB01373]|uniref:helix-turn-helix domain-containing protein n=1 Tax=Streptomyces sp. CB01373 TaxID=2020325 RepID=UPI000C27DC28|nr:hypothetical protein CG719_34810 [Streptomyces sp. CB01373]